MLLEKGMTTVCSHVCSTVCTHEGGEFVSLGSVPEAELPTLPILSGSPRVL